jgi:hypothetical protein
MGVGAVCLIVFVVVYVATSRFLWPVIIIAFLLCVGGILWMAHRLNVTQ